MLLLLEVLHVRFSSTFLSHSQEKKMSQQIEEEETTDISQHQVRVAVRVRPLLDPSTEKSVAETFPSKIKVTHEGRSRTYVAKRENLNRIPQILTNKTVSHITVHSNITKHLLAFRARTQVDVRKSGLSKNHTERTLRILLLFYGGFFVEGNQRNSHCVRTNGKW